MQLRQLWWPVPLRLDPLTWNNLLCAKAENQKQQASDNETDNAKLHTENSVNDKNDNNTLTHSDTTSKLYKGQL